MQFQEYPKWVYSDPTDAATGVLVQNAEEEAALGHPVVLGEVTVPTASFPFERTGEEFIETAAAEHKPAAPAKRTYNRRK